MPGVNRVGSVEVSSHLTDGDAVAFPQLGQSARPEEIGWQFRQFGGFSQDNLEIRIFDMK